MLERIQLPSQFDRVILTGGLVATLAALPILLVLLVLLLADAIEAPEFVFWLAFSVCVVGALGAVLLPNVVHAALSLIATLLGIAGVYLLLLSEFIALVQVLVYGGGVVILLLFGLMMTRAIDDPIVTDGSQKPFAAGVALVIGGVFLVALLEPVWRVGELTVVPFEDFGVALFRNFLVPVVVVAILLDVALTGAFINARRAPEEPVVEEASA